MWNANSFSEDLNLGSGVALSISKDKYEYITRTSWNQGYILRILWISGCFSFGVWDVNSPRETKDPKRHCSSKNEEFTKLRLFFLFPRPLRLNGERIKQQKLRVAFLCLSLPPLINSLTDLAVYRHYLSTDIHSGDSISSFLFFWCSVFVWLGLNWISHVYPLFFLQRHRIVYKEIRGTLVA